MDTLGSYRITVAVPEDVYPVSRTSEEQHRPAVIAIDGPGGSGKSTVSKALARRLRWRYLDSGALYRAATVAVLDAGADLEAAGDVARIVEAADIRLRIDPDDARTYLEQRDVSQRIRTREVTNAVSAVSAVPAVRDHLLAVQRSLIGEGRMVVEGRDIGTTVVPDAALKIFLTAQPAARAARRQHDAAAPDPAGLDVTLDEIARRDALDAGRSTSPLAQAGDAIEIDTTEMSVDDVVSVIMRLCEPLLAGDRHALGAQS